MNSRIVAKSPVYGTRQLETNQSHPFFEAFSLIQTDSTRVSLIYVDSVWFNSIQIYSIWLSLSQGFHVIQHHSTTVKTSNNLTCWHALIFVRVSALSTFYGQMLLYCLRCYYLRLCIGARRAKDWTIKRRKTRQQQGPGNNTIFYWYIVTSIYICVNTYKYRSICAHR